jgi:hypothetical protein
MASFKADASENARYGNNTTTQTFWLTRCQRTQRSDAPQRRFCMKYKAPAA